MLNITLQISSILVSVLLIGLILLQVRGEGLGSFLGGDSGNAATRTRRGLEKTLYQVTIGLCIAFVGISVLAFAFYR
ncbi:MAG: preprotein translocase subunit SecG [Phototrophicaceae bacterium]|jgi:preprotein translocase subunit SecG